MFKKRVNFHSLKYLCGYMDSKACHFQYYKYLLQILVLMLSLKRKETLLRVQCTGNFYQYFSSQVKCYMLPGYCLLHAI